MKTIIITIISILTGNFLFAQHARIVTSGSIEFEKTVNMHAITKQEVGPNPSDYTIQAVEQFNRTHPQFKKLTSTLVFGGNKTLYTPNAASDDGTNFQGNPMAKQFSTNYTDLSSGLSTIQKDIYGNTYLLKDSTARIKWKITGDTREIAGYTCRRANGIIHDSIYVVAFYTDKIWVSGGPESFSGLPGMILGVVLPHENVTWYATKVTDVAITPTTIVPPKKGKVVNHTELLETLKKAMRGWGAAGPYEVKVYLL
jgi:GLPGLI family protein